MPFLSFFLSFGQVSPPPPFPLPFILPFINLSLLPLPFPDLKISSQILFIPFFFYLVFISSQISHPFPPLSFLCLKVASNVQPLPFPGLNFLPYNPFFQFRSPFFHLLQSGYSLPSYIVIPLPFLPLPFPALNFLPNFLFFPVFFTSLYLLRTCTCTNN